MKEEKIELFLSEAMHIAPNFRKNLMPSSLNSALKISHHQLFCLMVICKNEGITMSELATLLGVSNQQLTRIMNELVENEFVIRFTDTTNRRLVKAKISEKGKEQLMAFHTTMNEGMAKAFEVLTEEELDQCLFHIQSLVALLSKVW